MAACPADQEPEGAHDAEGSSGGEGDEEAPPSDPEAYAREARQAYEEALADLRDGDCLAALPAFRKVRRKYVYSRFSTLAELRIGDCLLKLKREQEAISAYRRFVRNHPSHPQVPYARFKITQAYYRRIPEQWLLSPPPSERNPRPTREALRALRRFVSDYPDTEYTPEAKEMLREVMDILARHELYAARFYRKRGALRGALGRFRTLVDLYRGSSVEPEALLEMAEVLEALGEHEEARRTLERLVEEHPESDEADEARERLSGD